MHNFLLRCCAEENDMFSVMLIVGESAVFSVVGGTFVFCYVMESDMFSVMLEKVLYFLFRKVLCFLLCWGRMRLGIVLVCVCQHFTTYVEHLL